MTGYRPWGKRPPADTHLDTTSSGAHHRFVLRPAVTACGLCLSVLTVLAAGQGAPPSDPELAPLLARAGRAAEAWVAGFSAMVAEERFIQEWSSTFRSLESDVLLVKLNASGELFQFRDVFKVDNRVVRDRQGRLAALFVESPTKALEQAAQIDRASSTYNLRLDRPIEQATRAPRPLVNMPFSALGFLQATYQPRFRFTREHPERRIGRTVEVVNYEEIARPTLFGSVLERSSARDIVAKGRFRLEGDSGRVTRAELLLDYLTDGEDVVVTSFTFDDTLQMTVPREMRTEHYFGRSGLVRGHATYSRFRQFNVRTAERVEPFTGRRQYP